MNIGILTVRDRAYHPNRRLLETAEGKGHRAFLIPSPGEFRANFHLGARSRMHNLTDATARVAAAAAAATGLDIAGVDLIIEADGRIQVIEVNYAPGFRGLEAATGLDIASAIIDHAVAVIRRTSTGTQREFAE